jgi:uncharacterized membrane protein
MAAFFKTTILGGILFVLPLAFVLMIPGYLLKLAARVAKPRGVNLMLPAG